MTIEHASTIALLTYSTIQTAIMFLSTVYTSYARPEKYREMILSNRPKPVLQALNAAVIIAIATVVAIDVATIPVYIATAIIAAHRVTIVIGGVIALRRIAAGTRRITQRQDEAVLAIVTLIYAAITITLFITT